MASCLPDQTGGIKSLQAVHKVGLYPKGLGDEPASSALQTKQLCMGGWESIAGKITSYERRNQAEGGLDN
jgi:hypothetical protein